MDVYIIAWPRAFSFAPDEEAAVRWAKKYPTGIVMKVHVTTDTIKEN